MSQLKNMMDQVKKLKNGVGVQSLLDAAYEILGNPIVMFDTEYKLLAHNDVTSDDAIWNEIVTYGTFSKETQNFFGDEGFIEDIANSPRITLLRSKKLKYDRYSGKLFNKNKSYVSNLVIVESNKPFEENDFMIFYIICKLVSREISKSEFYQEYEQTHQETLMRNLIDGNYDVNLDLAQVGILYDTLATSLYIAVADLSQCNQDYVNVTSFKNLLKQKKPAYKYAMYSDYIIILISTNEEVLNVNKELRELVKIFEQSNIYVGISSRFENLFELNKYYAEALESLSYVLENKCSQRLFPFNPSSHKKIKQIKAVSNGKGIQHFLNKGPKIFGNPLLFHDMELNLLGYTEDVEIIDPIWEELITYGTSSDETIRLFGTEGFIATMENTKGGALLISEKIKYDRISWKVYNSDKIMIGCLSIVNTNSQFTEDELILFGAFSQKFSKEIDKNEFYNNYGQIYSETLINRLISAKIDDYIFYSLDIGNIYNNLMNNLYLVVIDATHSDKSSLTYFRDLFSWAGTVNRYAIYLNQIIIIISVESLPLNENEYFSKLGKVFEQQNIYAGISSCFENIYDLQRHYKEAVDALNFGIKISNGKQRIFEYDKINIIN